MNWKSQFLYHFIRTLPKPWRQQISHLCLASLGVDRDLYYNILKKIPPKEQNSEFQQLVTDNNIQKHAMLKSDRLLTIFDVIKYLPDNPLIIEVGAYKGGTSLFILETCKHFEKRPTMLVFDTFDGHVTAHSNDPYHQSGSEQFKDTSFELVQKLLHGFNNVNIIKGDAVKTIPKALKERNCGINFLHLDTDVYPVTLKVLHMIWPVLEPGGIIIVDDYGTKTCPGVMSAVSEFLEATDQSDKLALTLPSSQKILIKKYCIER